MGHPLVTQAGTGALEHQAHGRIPRAESRKLLLVEDSRVRVGQHAPFEGDLAGLDEEIGRRAVAA